MDIPNICFKKKKSLIEAYNEKIVPFWAATGTRREEDDDFATPATIKGTTKKMKQNLEP